MNVMAAFIMRNLLPKIHPVLVIMNRIHPIYRPVPVDLLIDAIIEAGAAQGFVIEFIGAPIDHTILKGFFIKTKNKVQIYYSTNLSEADQRYVIAKETVHIFDSEEELTPPDGRLGELLERLCVADHLPQTHASFAERRAEWGALEILFPYEARRVLRGSFYAAKNGFAGIAKIYCIPEFIVQVGMHDAYNDYIKEEREFCGIRPLASD